MKPDLTPTCPTCRYNLTGLPDGLCPECGRPFTLEALMRPRPKRGVLTDARFYCLLIATFVFIALVSTSLPLMATGGALASLIICSLVRQRVNPRHRTLSISGAVFAGAAILTLGLALDLLIITLDGYIQPYHWTRLDNPFVPASAPLNERIVTRTQCLVAGGCLLPPSIATIFLTRRTITAATHELVKPANEARTSPPRR